MKNRLIFIEGTVGSGKSTTCNWLMSKFGSSVESLSIYPEPVPISTNSDYLFGEAKAMRYPHPGGDWEISQWDGVVESMIESRLKKVRAFTAQCLEQKGYSILDGGLFHRDLDALFMLGMSRHDIIEHLSEFVEVMKELDPVVIYLNHPDVRSSLNEIHQKRGDLWHQGETAYFVDSPYGISNGHKGFSGYVDIYKELKDLHFTFMD